MHRSSDRQRARSSIPSFVGSREFFRIPSRRRLAGRGCSKSLSCRTGARGGSASAVAQGTRRLCSASGREGHNAEVEDFGAHRLLADTGGMHGAHWLRICSARAPSLNTSLRRRARRRVCGQRKRRHVRQATPALDTRVPTEGVWQRTEVQLAPTYRLPLCHGADRPSTSMPHAGCRRSST